MSKPNLEFIPLRPAICSDAPVTLDVLLRIAPPAPTAAVKRPPLNLGLAIDRSGSMAAENKIGYARQAAAFAIQQLLPTDRISVVTFDDKIETIIPNTAAENRQALLDAVGAIEPRGSTALFDGWREAARQVHAHFLKGGLNRVILLSDGLANVGESRPEAIAQSVRGETAEGVSTTTLGVGNDYNDVLLIAMADAGDGNYQYIESPVQLPAIFEKELTELANLFGNTVSLGIEPAAGATVADVLNDFEKTSTTGRLKLPNLIGGCATNVVFRLNVPPQPAGEVCKVRLAWNAPGGGRQSLRAALDLPAVPKAAWDSLAPHVEVQELAAFLQIARLKKAITAKLVVGDEATAKQLLAAANSLLATVPQSPEVAKEAAALDRIEGSLDRHMPLMACKLAGHQSRQRRYSK